jgi:tetratricopeptide (TPR) repeat protein
MKRSSRKSSIVILLGGMFLLAPSARADYKQAYAYYMQGRYDKAIQELKPDLDQNPDWEFGHRLVGLSYLNLKNNALAISSLTRAVQLKSTAFATYYGLGQAYFNMQKYDNCTQALDQGEPFAKSGDEKYKLHHLKGSAYFRQDRYNETVNEITAALRDANGDWSDYSELGIAYHSLRRYDEAIQALQKAAALNPGQITTSEFLGKAFLAKGAAALAGKQYGQALDSLRKAKDFNPKDGYIYYNMAEALLFQKNYPEAEKALNQALDLLPRNADVLVRLGLIYEKQRKWDQALNAYQKAQEITPAVGIKEAIGRVTEAKKQK